MPATTSLHTDYVMVWWSAFTPPRSNHTAALARLHSWGRSFLPPLVSMEAVALFSYTASEADEISFQRGDVIKVSVLSEWWFELDKTACWSETGHCTFAPRRWQKWMTTLVGSRQRFRGSAATCQRTTSLSSLIRKNFMLITILLSKWLLFHKCWGFTWLLWLLFPLSRFKCFNYKINCLHFCVSHAGNRSSTVAITRLCLFILGQHGLF